MAKVYGLYGASGFGQEVMYWLLLKLEREQDNSKVVYVDDGSEASEVDGIPVVTYEQFIGLPEDEKLVFLAIANSAIREKLDKKVTDDGVAQFSLKGDYSFVRGASFEEGFFLSAYVDVTANVKVGRCFHGNTYSYIGHDCVIGDYVTFAPRVSCNGNVHIHDHAYIGTGAILKQGTPDKPLIS